MDKTIPIIIVALIAAVLALFLLTETETTSPECGDNFCASGETAKNCPDDCAGDDWGSICQKNSECNSGVCDFIKQDIGVCKPADCENDDEAVAIDGQIVFECQDGEWVEVDGPQTCKDNPYCELQLPCDNPDEIRVLRADQYSDACVESMAQMVLPTVCIVCDDGVCGGDESKCNCPEDCADYPDLKSCQSDDECSVNYNVWNGGKCDAGCFNSIAEGDSRCDLKWELIVEDCVCVEEVCTSASEKCISCCESDEDCVDWFGAGFVCVDEICEMEVDYSCNTDSDCVSTCGVGCANSKWAETYEDPCINVRAWDCACANNLCYTDGNPPSGIIL